MTSVMIALAFSASAFAVDPKWSDEEWTNFEKAIHQVETSGKGIGTIGDNGKAYGPLQIHAGCFEDSNVLGEWKDCLKNLELSKKVLRAYIKRYLPKNGTMLDAARIWNGGPKGHTKKATLEYSKKFEKRLKEVK